jgi:hypothetical protein
MKEYFIVSDPFGSILRSLDYCPCSPGCNQLNQTEEAGWHSVLIAMQGHPRKWDGEKYENKAEHDVFPNSSSQGHRRKSSYRFPEGLNSVQM